LITEISDGEKPVMYPSELAEREIRDCIREADENVYKKGFVVDAGAQIGPAGQITAYAIMILHKIIDLEE